MNLDEESLTFLILLLPLPFMALTYKFANISFFFLTFLGYLFIGIVGPMYIHSRHLSVYQKANLLLWLKMTGTVNFTPEEHEMINRALGIKRKKPVRNPKSPFRKHWKIITLLSIITLTVIIGVLPTGEQFRPEYTTIDIVDITINRYKFTYDFYNITIKPRQYLQITFSLNTTNYGNYLFSVIIYNETGDMIGKEHIGREFYKNVNGFTVDIILDYPLKESSKIKVKLIFTNFKWEKTIEV